MLFFPYDRKCDFKLKHTRSRHLFNYTIKFKIISHRFICFKKLLFHSPLLTKNTNKFKTTQHIFILMDLSKFKPLFYYLILIVIYIDF